MAVITASDIVGFVTKARQNGWGYVYSAQGQLYTRELAEKWGKANRSGKGYDYFVNKCSRWFGKTVVDCSGLVIEAYRSKIQNYGDKSANTIYSKTVSNGDIKTIPEIPGLCVWRSGHIGVYIGNKNVIEAGGTNNGVVVSKVNAPATDKPWTRWGKMADVDYSSVITPPAEEAPSFWLGRHLKVTSPYIKGDDVAQVQEALLEKGFSPGKIDGIYGPKTEKAVREFQTQAKITVDGIVGKDTTKALLGSWIIDCDGKSCCPENETPLGAFELGRLLKLATPYMRGDDVSDVQDALKSNGFSPGKVDGIYGKITQGAVKKFQKAKALKVDGIVGVNTVTALGGVWTL
jgi:peptidoglycan hydrolase-like protein with peptidoglycan-binding domain